jgi:putative tryptophan/tyrosine transport system substrate-binding protein
MVKQRRSLTFIITIFITVSMVGAVQAEPRYNIAVVQHQQFLPFQQAHDAFIQNLEILGTQGDYHIVDDFNAQSDIGALESKINELAGRSDLDLIFTIGTHSTKRMIKAEKKTPIVYTIVGDPQNAGIVSDWRSSGANYTGVETPEYYTKVVRLMHHFVAFKSLGMIYLIGSPSHEAGIRQISALSRELGFKFVAKGFPLRDENRVRFLRDQIRSNMQSALEMVCPQVEVVFVQTSSTFTKEFDLFMAAFLKHRTVSAGDPTNIQKGLVMGIGKDANRFGRQCAQYAVKILQGTAPADLPMDTGVKLSVDVNLKAAELVGFEPPFELISGADNLFQDVNLTDIPSVVKSDR